MQALTRFHNYLTQFSRELWILALGWFVGALGFAISIPFISIYFNTVLGMSTTEIGLFFGAMAAIRAVFQALGGELADRLGRRIMLIGAQYFRAGTFLLLGLSIYFDWGFWPIALALFLNSVFGAVFMTVVTTLVSDIVPPEKRLDGFAISRSAGNAGWAVGPAIGGYLAHSSYAQLFYFSAILTVGCAMIFQFFMHIPRVKAATDRFKFSDLLAIRHDKFMAIHGFLTLGLYLVVAQLVAPLSVYAVGMVGLDENQLGRILTLNGIMVVLLQLPITRLLIKFRLTTQLAAGAVLYFAGYSLFGTLVGFDYFLMLIFVVTIGELFISPPCMTITSRLAPEGRTGRYMGIHGFFLTAGWSLGPLYGGFFLDTFSHNWSLAWLLIASLALVASLGYVWFARILPEEVNRPQKLLDNN